MDPVDVGQAWMADLEDPDEPETDLEYWEADELTPEELRHWYGGQCTERW